MARRPDIAEVAKHARVSKSTVSRVINGGYASAEVRARVAKVISKLGYTPWTTARNFSLGRAGCFGLVMEDSQSEWITQILGGIEEELTSKHISLLVGSLVLRGTYDSATVVSWIKEHRVDGLIFARPGRRERPLVEAARKAKLALSLITPDESFRGGAVLRSNNIDAGREIAEHLYELGHRRVAYVGGPEDSMDSRQRAQGVVEGLAMRKLKMPASNLIFAPRYHFLEGVSYADRWVKMPRGRAPTAVVLANDVMALGFLRTLQSHGVSIPKEVSVVGFDDTPESGYYTPPLTTVRQDLREVGRRAVELVLSIVAGEALEQHLAVPPELVVRRTTAAPPPARP